MNEIQFKNKQLLPYEQAFIQMEVCAVYRFWARKRLKTVGVRK